VLAAQPVIDAEGPNLEVGKDPVNPGQDDMDGHLTDDMGLVGKAGGVIRPTIGLGEAPEQRKAIDDPHHRVDRVWQPLFLRSTIERNPTGET